MRFALRSLLKSPGFTGIALVTLALGIGVNTAMFSVVRAFLLQPAPYPDAGRLMRVYRTSPQSKTWPHSSQDLADLRAQNHVLASLAAFQWWDFSLAAPGQPPERLQGILASADLLTTLGVQPALGRNFTAAEQQPGRDQVVILTDTLWRSRFAADSRIIGRTIRVDGTNQTVIGVMPASFSYPIFWGKLDAIRPLVFAADWQRSRNTHWLDAIGRLKPGVSLAQARTELATIAARLAQQYPDTNAGTSVNPVPLHETALDEASSNVSWLTLGLSGFVLLIACANLANLQLARAAARARDFAVRAALGASRTRLIRQLLSESVLLALIGGTLGVLLAVWLDEFLCQRIDIAGGATLSIPLDWTVLGFAFAASCFVGLLSGTAPAWFASRADVNSALKQQSRGATGDRSRHHFRHSLIVAEIAFAVVLLAGAAFFLRGLQRLSARDPGWRPSGLLTGTLTLPETLPTDRYVTDESRRQFYARLLPRLAALPGVQNASISSSVPIRSYNSSRNFSVEGRPDPAPGQEPLADQVLVTPDFFHTLGLELVAGRLLPDNPRVDSPHVAVINETMARQFWPGESAVGKRIGSTDPKERDWTEVIGVVRDVDFVANLGLPDTRFQVYRPIVQEPWGYLTITLRAPAPETLAEPLRRAVAEIDPDLPVVNVRTIMQTVEHVQHNFRALNQMLVGFAALGLGLAGIGLYGVISALVAQRTQEFGIRLALGAQTRDVLWLVLGKSIWLTAVGSAFGLAGAVVLAVLLGKLMPGLPGFDPFTLAAIVALQLFVGVIACFLPARRATTVDPIIALRAE
jgi:putative ABC transport system permease protein